MTPFEKLKAADHQAAVHVLEAAGHVFAGDRGGLTAWCRRIGVTVEELDATTHVYRDGVERGTRSRHVEYW